ncbi:MAG: endonuclease/exonuclease/phosphatase family protein [bacterium]|nr:endonuclease/exonuclease/phosphatase family protein [bacterium]
MPKKTLSILVPVGVLLLGFLLVRIATRDDAAPVAAVRIGQFNIWEMSTTKITDVDEAGAGRNGQLLAAAAIIREIAPEILIINEIDHDYDAVARGEDLALNARRFNDLYLNRGANPLDYPYVYAAPCNTGFLTGKDLDNDGIVATARNLGEREHGGDAYGYGVYPGQYSMAILSRYPLDVGDARTWRMFRWIDLPDNLITPDRFTDDELSIYRLSSKSHWDVPVQIGDRRLHLLVSHPTPTGYDGPEDQNGRRNYDEIRMWVHYLDNDSVLVDDAGVRGGLDGGESFVIMGDLNADPHGDVLETGQRAIEQLLKHERVVPTGRFLTSAGALQGREPGAPDHFERHTVGWEGGGLRIDYILPSVDLTPIGGGVYWPAESSDPAGAARAELASDHHLTWLDIKLTDP